MQALSVKLPGHLHASLSKEAHRRHITRSALVREILEEGLVERQAVEGPSCLDLVEDLIGDEGSGIPDLATNPRYLEEAILADAARGASNRRR